MKMAVIGAGTMGSGIAQILAEAQKEVWLIDKDEVALKKAKDNIEQAIRFGLLLQKKDPREKETITKYINYTTSLEDAKDVQFVIENITERIHDKMNLYQELNQVITSDCIIMVNTSCISITQLASCVDCPERVVGAHFMNPVSKIKTVEMVRGQKTEDTTIEKVCELLDSLGRDYVVVNDFPGFVANRISHLMMNEAAFIVQDGVATPSDVDKVFTQCYGHKMGPLATADLIGLDTVVDSLQVLCDSYQDSKYRCCPLLKKMVAAGELGRKSQKGFYSY